MSHSVRTEGFSGFGTSNFKSGGKPEGVGHPDRNNRLICCYFQVDYKNRASLLCTLTAGTKICWCSNPNCVSHKSETKAPHQEWQKDLLKRRWELNLQPSLRWAPQRICWHISESLFQAFLCVLLTPDSRSHCVLMRLLNSRPLTCSSPQFSVALPINPSV